MNKKLSNIIYDYNHQTMNNPIVIRTLSFLKGVVYTILFYEFIL